MKAIKAIQSRHYPTFTYKGKPIQMVQSFKYLGNSVPSTNIWKVCYESRLQVGGNSYYMLENQWNQSDIRQWEVKLMLFNVMVVQVLLDRVEVWGDILSLSAWNEIEKNQNLFLHRKLLAKSSTSYPITLLETSSQAIEYTSISQKSWICLIMDCQTTCSYVDNLGYNPQHPTLSWY